WSSDVCSSDLISHRQAITATVIGVVGAAAFRIVDARQQVAERPVVLPAITLRRDTGGTIAVAVVLELRRFIERILLALYTLARVMRPACGVVLGVDATDAVAHGIVAIAGDHRLLAGFLAEQVGIEVFIAGGVAVGVSALEQVALAIVVLAQDHQVIARRLDTAVQAVVRVARNKPAPIKLAGQVAVG